jgi:hypothetical protein
LMQAATQKQVDVVDRTLKSVRRAASEAVKSRANRRSK